MPIPLAVVGGIAAAGALANAFGSKKKSGYTPNKKNLKAYEGYERSDIDRLYSPTGFEGPGLGFNATEMGARMGAETQESAAELAADRGSIMRGAAVGGGLRAGSGSYNRGLQRAMQGHLGRTSEIRRRNVLANALQKRTDLYGRLDATGRAYRGGAGLYNKRMEEPKNPMLAAVGQGMTGFAGAYTVPKKPAVPKETYV